MQVRVIGDITRLAPDLQDQIRELEEFSAKNTGLHFQVALNYGIPDPDLMIRTSGEQRLSNYLLWQMAYTEFYFTDCLWPDFNKKELEKAVEYYQQRDRRFGGVK